ncbi:TonB-dependent receptor domain-containing protein [Photobacterium lutimaris]|uniref:TonB-dependent receptor n=1 Tax=Photobacterium lutimaris TaxID=388278 RepID=A0A2T3J3N0_9GAMM|nr:TonB-dependent receptor [Photobacterium lutimaris]PSU35853.1 TonB-dependent receptor [Photobacterium lutimaris]TDR78925.1 outer membrane receptor for ferrienterochelin and colicins [Photobacterium lutimaris]
MYTSTHFIRKPLAMAVASVFISMPVYAEFDRQDEQTDEQMVVTATRTETTLAKAPASISVVTEEDILSEPSLALNDLVKNIAGVESQMDGGRAGREMISIRGLNPKFTMILVNGRKLSSSNAIFRGNDFDLSAIPKESIERVEVIRGPMSALYGSEALGGVINVITKQPTNEWNSQISGDYSYRDDDNGGQYSAGFNTSGALIDDELYMSLAVSQTARDAYSAFSGQAEGSNGEYDRSQATTLEERETLAVSGNVLWYINDMHDIAFDFSYTDDERDGIIESTVGLTDSDSRVKRDMQAVTYNGMFDWGEAQLRYNRDAVSSVDAAEVDTGVSDIDETNQQVYGHGTTYIGSHTLTFGGEWSYSELDNPESLTKTGKADVHEQALFVQDQWEINDAYTLTYGTRLDFHEAYGSHWSPRAYLVNTVTDKLTLKGGVGSAFNAPTLLQTSEENVINSCKGDCQVVGNPDLDPETSVSYEVSAIYNEALWSIEAGLFRNDIKNLIDQDRDNAVGISPDGRDIYTYKNINKAMTQGLELTAHYDVTESIQLNGAYTYLDTEDKTTGKELEDRPDHQANVRMTWYATEWMDTFLRVNYTGEALIDTGSDLYRPSFTTADLGMNYLINSDWRLRAGVRNITDEQFDDFEVTRRSYSIEPRSWYLGMTANF